MYRDVSMTDGSSCVNEQNSRSDDDDDDEFFECETDTSAAAAYTLPAATDTSEMSQCVMSPMQCDDADGWRDTSLEFASSLPYQADGRLKQCGDLRLLNLNEQLYVPVTQEPAPMTEDMLEEHAEVLARYSLCFRWSTRDCSRERVQ